jgi:hypothetical protein
MSLHSVIEDGQNTSAEVFQDTCEIVAILVDETRVIALFAAAPSIREQDVKVRALLGEGQSARDKSTTADIENDFGVIE